jgi:hypothetical protein
VTSADPLRPDGRFWLIALVALSFGVAGALAFFVGHSAALAVGLLVAFVIFGIAAVADVLFRAK